MEVKLKKILLVDDELHILKALGRVFMDTDYEILTAESGDEALQMLATNSVDLIMSDMRMPRMDGYELLVRVKKDYPDIIRIILSGYTDEKIVLKALQNSVAILYVVKPWDNSKLIKMLEQVFETKEILISANLLSIINKTEHLPTMEDSYHRILELIDKEADLSTISQEIEKNQSTTIKILHVANSAYYNIKTGSIKQAITYIGIQNTRNLVWSTSIMEGFITKDRYRSEIELIWNHAYITNKLVSFLYQKHLNKKLPDTASTTGLMHNIGIVLLIHNYGEEYIKLVKNAIEQRRSILEAERERYLVTHNEVGSYLLKWWEFPYDIVEATMYHGSPLDQNIINNELVCVLHIAQGYAWKKLNVELVDNLDIRTFELLNITIDSFEDSLATMTL
jgi:HD-like signal output (HDOD) protein/CheY-like chemotaxis protein